MINDIDANEIPSLKMPLTDGAKYTPGANY